MSAAALTIHIDGAARGNPGPAAFAYVITGDGMRTIEEADRLGKATNNVAEYTALLRALEKAADLGAQRLMIYSDSELLVKQMKGQYRVKNEDLCVLYDQAKKLESGFQTVTYSHVPRARNSEADRLCNEALDGLRGASKIAAPGPSVRSAASSTLAAPAAGPSPRQAAVREEAVACLDAALAAWEQGRPDAPSSEEIWDQLWSILEENGVLRPPRRG